MGAIVITLEGLVAGRGGEALTAPLDLSLRAGEALVVTGANGAGKSTLLRTLAGLLPPLVGAVRLEGAVAPDGEPARGLGEAAHYLGHRNAMKGGETLIANLAFWQRHFGVGADRLRLDAALEAFDLAALAGLTLAHLSAGQQRRAALARLLVAPRPVWLLDEPTGALDSRSRERFAAAANAHLAAGGLLVAATHLSLGVEARELALEAPAQGEAEDAAA